MKSIHFMMLLWGTQQLAVVAVSAGLRNAF